MAASIIRAAALTLATATVLTSCARMAAPAAFGTVPAAGLRATLGVTSFKLAGEHLNGPNASCPRKYFTRGTATGPYPGTFQAWVQTYRGNLEVSFIIASGQLTIKGGGYAKAFGCSGQIPYKATFSKGGRPVGTTSGRAAVTSDLRTHLFSLVFETG